MISNKTITQIFDRFKDNNPSPDSELLAENNYTFTIAVLLSAQSTDKAVNKATSSLFEIANNPKKMLEIGLDVLKYHIKTIGLYNNKAKNIMALSQILIDKYHGAVPETRDELEDLPGIGRKSANVIMNHCFNGEFIPVDTHVLRLSNRLGLTEAKGAMAVEKELIERVPMKYHRNASDWLVLHGRYVCVARKPKCSECFLMDICPKILVDKK